MFMVEIETPGSPTGRVGMVFPDLETAGNMFGESWDSRKSSDRIVLRFFKPEDVAMHFRAMVRAVGHFDRLTCHIADSFLNIVRAGPADRSDPYKVIHVDTHSGDFDATMFTYEQAIALVMLSIGSDEIDNSEEYYALLNPIIDEWKTRPIP